MYEFIRNMVRSIENIVYNTMTLESDREINQPQLFVRIEINNRFFHFGTFDSIERLEQWIQLNDLEHLKYQIIDLHHPGSPREDWPI